MKYTKLQEMLAETLDRNPDSSDVTGVIDTMAEWFELVLEDMGIMPSSIPSLLRWQYLHGEYAMGNDTPPEPKSNKKLELPDF
jgi:hypothetical protein